MSDGVEGEVRVSSPLVSVVVPVRNKKPHLQRCLDSVLSQELQDFELCLVDDASTDGGYELLQVYAESDARIRLFRRQQPGPGGYAARNLGISAANGRWIAFLDADDEWGSTHLTRLREVELRYPDIDLISCGWNIVSPEGEKSLAPFAAQYVGRGDRHFSVEDYMSGPCPICMDCAIVRSSAFAKVGTFDERWKHGADLEMWLRLLCEMEGGAVWLDQVTATYFRDSVNMVTSNLQQTVSPSAVYIRELLDRDSGVASVRYALLRRFANKAAFKPYLRGLASGELDNHCQNIRFFSSDQDWRIRVVLTLIRLMPSKMASAFARMLLGRYEN